MEERPDCPRLGDLDGDGIPDLATANQYDGSVSVCLGDGDGTFAPRVNYGVGTLPGSVAIGDLNDDGNPDLVATCWSDDKVSVLLGTGGGAFAPRVRYPTSIWPTSVALGDLNKDGALDVAVAAGFNNVLSVLLGNGDGTLGPYAWYGVGHRPVCVKLVDLDMDGQMDAVVANSLLGGVSVLLGNGDGTFGESEEYDVGAGAGSIAIGDLDRDGDPDLAVTSRPDGVVTILLNRTIQSSAVGGAVYALPLANGNIELRWTLDALAGIEGLSVYRATTRPEGFSRVTEELLPACSPGVFIDTSVWPETTFWYELRALGTDGSEETVGAGPVYATAAGTLHLRLAMPSPNPFSLETRLGFEVPVRPGMVRLRILNANGQVVRTLIEGHFPSGRHAESWDGYTDSGLSAPSGVYFVELAGGDKTERQKVLLVR